MARLNSQQIDRHLTGECFRRLVEHAPDAICVLRDERLLYANAAAVRWMAAESDQLVGRHITDFVNPDAIPLMRAGVAALQAIGESSVAFEAQMLRPDGTTLSVEAVSVLTLWESEPAYQLVFRDVSARKAAQEQDFETIVQLLSEGVIVMRNDGYPKFINPAAMQIHGLGSKRAAADFLLQATTSPCYDAGGTRVPPELHPTALAFRTGVSFTKEIYGMDLPNGERRWLLTSGRQLNPDDPENSDVLISFSDITAEREDLDRLVYQANHDPLTGLPNRAFVLRRIAEALAATDCGRLRAVLFIDLDDLKTTNDTFGHEAGDHLLNSAAARLRQAVSSDDVVGRHGGDEFVALIFGGDTRGELDNQVGRMRDRLAEPVVIGDTTLPIRASVGIVEVDRDDRRNAEEILRDADRAMYKAKRASHSHDR